MLLIFSTPGLIRCLWQLKTVVFLHWCLIYAFLLSMFLRGNFDSVNRAIYMRVRFRIRLAHVLKYKNNYILKKALT